MEEFRKGLYHDSTFLKVVCFDRNGEVCHSQQWTVVTTTSVNALDGFRIGHPEIIELFL